MRFTLTGARVWLAAAVLLIGFGAARPAHAYTWMLARDGVHAALWKRQAGAFLVDRTALEREAFDG